MPAQNRYKDLIGLLPPGGPYDAQGPVIPYRDSPQVFQFSTSQPNTTWQIYLNQVASGYVTTDANGNAVVSTIPFLPVGEYLLNLVGINAGSNLDGSPVQKVYYFTVRAYATWYAAYADVLNAIDAQIQDGLNALSLETVSSNYAAAFYGQQVHQPQPSTFLLNEYRALIRTLRTAYRHFGGHPYGLYEAVRGLTSVNPFIVPKAWRPTWVLGTQLCPNGRLSQRSRLSTAQFGPAGAISASLSPELPNLNRQAAYSVLGSISPGSTITAALRQPSIPQVLTVTFNSNGQTCILSGTDDTGLSYVEMVPDPSITPIIGTYATQKAFSVVSSVQLTGTGNAASVGLGNSRFIQVEKLGSFNAAGASLNLTYSGMTSVTEMQISQPLLSWNGGAVTPVILDTITSDSPPTTKQLIADLGVMTLEDPEAHFTPDMIGQPIVISGCLNFNNNLMTMVAGVSSETALTFFNTFGLSETSAFSWSIQATTGTVTLYDDAIPAYLVGAAETASSFSLDPNATSTANLYQDQISLNINGLGDIRIQLTPSSGSVVTPVSVVSQINSALGADPRYTALVANPAAIVTGTQGDTNSCISITGTGITSVQLRPCPADASAAIFGLPVSSTMVLIGASTASTSLVCKSTAAMPNVAGAGDPNRQFKAQIRGLKTGNLSGSLTTGTPSTNAVISLTGSGYTFTSFDIGGWVRWSDGSTSTNNGIHKIISVSGGNATVLHQLSFSGSTFTTSTGNGVVYGQGEVVTVVSNNKMTNTLTLSAAPAFGWPVGAIVDVLSEVPYVLSSSIPSGPSAGSPQGPGSITVRVNTNYRPYHDRGDSISFVSGTTWRLTSSRANFAGLSGATVIITNASNAENNGSFVLTSVSGQTCQFTNVLGVAETSSFNWSIDDLGILPVTVTDAVSIQGSTVPNGWSVSSGTTAVLSRSVPGRLNASKLYLTSASASNVVLSRPVPDALEYVGLPLDLTVWLNEHTLTGTTYSLSVSFDGINFYSLTSTTAPSASLAKSITSGADYVSAPNPFAISGTFFVPSTATTCVVQIERSASSGVGTCSIEKVILASPTGTGYAMGVNTIPRNAKRSKFGELLYVWSVEELQPDEVRYLGLPTDSTSIAQTPGHIDYITTAHGYFNRLDISEVDDSGLVPVRTNIRGVYDSNDWTGVQAANGLTQMLTYIGTPARASYAYPLMISHVSKERATFVSGGGGSGVQSPNMLNISNHQGPFPQAPNTGSGTGAMLYEVKASDYVVQGPFGYNTIPAGTPIPLPYTIDNSNVYPWEFIASNQIQINAAYYTSSSTYYLDYDLLMQVTGPAFQLTDGTSNPPDYVWLADLTTFLRHDSTESDRPRTEQLIFGLDYVAALKGIADVNQPATLTKNDGLTTSTLGVGDWSFQSDSQVVIQPDAFNTNAIYLLSYQALEISINANESVNLYWRQAYTEGGLTSATWTQVQPGQILTPTFDSMGGGGNTNISLNNVYPWHQMMVTVNGIVDIRDLKIYGFGMKGVHMFGVSPNAPMILLPQIS